MGNKSSTLLPLIQKRISEKQRFLEREKVTAWVMHKASHKGHIEDFYGKKLSSAGVTFEGSPRDVFWGRFIEPFLEDFTSEMIELVSKECDDNKLKITIEFEALKQNLSKMFIKIYHEMAQADQKMMKIGHSKETGLMNIQPFLMKMENYLDTHIRMAIEKLKSRNSLKHKILVSVEEQTITWVVSIFGLLILVLWDNILAMYEYLKISYFG